MFQGLLEAIEDYDVITIYRHINADMDALGSQYGLKNWILDNYPNKKVFALGNDRDDTIFPITDQIDDSTIQESLAIVLDCAGRDRIDDQRFSIAKHIIAIDHHPFQDQFMSEDYRLVHYAAACEVLTEFFIQTKKVLSKTTATYLYRGLLTDTMSFKTNNTSAHTLMMAAELCKTGIDIVQCNHDVFDLSKTDFELATMLRSKAIIEDCGLVYCLLQKEDCKKFGIPATKAKEMVYQFQNVTEFDIWCIFAENQEGMYEGSLRSKSLTINQIAAKYHGGGHNCACGVRDLTLDDVHDCLADLRSLLKQA